MIPAMITVCVRSCSYALHDFAFTEWQANRDLLLQLWAQVKADFSGWVHPWECDLSTCTWFYLHDLFSDYCAKQQVVLLFILYPSLYLLFVLSWRRRSGASTIRLAPTCTDHPAWPLRWSDSTLCCRRRSASRSSERSNFRSDWLIWGLINVAGLPEAANTL